MGREARKMGEIQLRKTHILESAQRLYADKGVEEVTMDQIAAAAGYTKRTVYSYFKNKEEIQMTLLLLSLTARWEESLKAMGKTSGPKEKLMAFAETYFTFFKNNPSHLQLYVYLDYHGVDQAAARKEVFDKYRAVNEEVIGQIRSLLKEGVRTGIYRSDLNIEMTISHMVYTLRTVINRAFSKKYSFAKFDAGQYYREYLKLFLRGISRGPGGGAVGG